MRALQRATDIALHGGFQPLGRRAAAGGDGVEQLDLALGGCAEHIDEKLGLRRKVAVQRAGGQTRGLGDGRHPVLSGLTHRRARHRGVVGRAHAGGARRQHDVVDALRDIHKRYRALRRDHVVGRGLHARQLVRLRLRLHLAKLDVHLRHRWDLARRAAGCAFGGRADADARGSRGAAEAAPIASRRYARENVLTRIPGMTSGRAGSSAGHRDLGRDEGHRRRVEWLECARAGADARTPRVETDTRAGSGVVGSGATKTQTAPDIPVEVVRKTQTEGAFC